MPALKPLSVGPQYDLKGAIASQPGIDPGSQGPYRVTGECSHVQVAIPVSN